MSIIPIVFVLIILLFGFDSTGQVETRRQCNYGEEEEAAALKGLRNKSEISEISIFESLWKK